MLRAQSLSRRLTAGSGTAARLLRSVGSSTSGGQSLRLSLSRQCETGLHRQPAPITGRAAEVRLRRGRCRSCASTTPCTGAEKHDDDDGDDVEEEQSSPLSSAAQRTTQRRCSSCTSTTHSRAPLDPPPPSLLTLRSRFSLSAHSPFSRSPRLSLSPSSPWLWSLDALDELATGFEGCEKKVEIDFPPVLPHGRPPPHPPHRPRLHPRPRALHHHLLPAQRGLRRLRPLRVLSLPSTPPRSCSRRAAPPSSSSASPPCSPPRAP